MNKPMYSNILTKLATPPMACERYKLSRSKLMEIAEKADAIRRFGRSVRVDIEKMDCYLENMK